MTGPALPQRRAAAALKLIQAYAEAAPEKERLAYAGYIKSLPAAIVMNGLGQALATELAQGGKDTGKGQGGIAPNAHAQIYRHLEQWLCGDDPEVPFRCRRLGRPASEPVLMHCLCEADQQIYLLAQAESMAFIEWLKKFANAFLTTGGAP
jgi:CRISPR-associated protein Cmr5